MNEHEQEQRELSMLHPDELVLPCAPYPTVDNIERWCEVGKSTDGQPAVVLARRDTPR